MINYAEIHTLQIQISVKKNRAFMVFSSTTNARICQIQKAGLLLWMLVLTLGFLPESIYEQFRKGNSLYF